MYEKSRAIKKNDLIYFDYAGYLGDEAFEGGTAKNQELLIGSGNFIPGFEDAVIGHTPGNEFSIDVTFPKDYHAADLAGKAVVFKITVHHIYPEISEESVALLGEAYKLKFEKEAAQSSEEKVYKPSFTDKSSYEKYVVSVLKAKKEQSFNESKRNLVLNAIVENTKFTSYPQDIIDDYDEIVEKQAEQYGIEKDVFLSYFYGIGTEEQYTEFLQKQVSSECVIIGIIQTEKFTVTEDEITKSAEEIAKQYGFTTVEELYKQVPKVSVENNLLSNKALDFITENAVITTIDETSKS
ncbi:MAG: FKBP-type peptidyl-prolyl cis-trans isomerase [Clostridia bacterium]|nr:FKBP-type peptidyl-prolyl cis-trans isomerase [Clostridia bacterium]